MSRTQTPVENGIRLTLNLKPEEYEMLNRMAEKEERTRSWIARAAIREMYAHHFSETNA